MRKGVSRRAGSRLFIVGQSIASPTASRFFEVRVTSYEWRLCSLKDWAWVSWRYRRLSWHVRNIPDELEIIAGLRAGERRPWQAQVPTWIDRHQRRRPGPCCWVNGVLS